MPGIDELYDYAARTEFLRDDILHAEFPPSRRKGAPLFTVNEAAQYLEIKPTTLQKLVRDEEVTCTLSESGKRFFNPEQIYRAREQLQKNATKKNYMPSSLKKNGKPYVLSVSNLKGGSSKTTTCVHLCQYAVLMGYKVLLIDSDPQGSSSSIHGLFPYQLTDETSGESYGEFVNLEDTLLSIYSREESKRDLKPLKTSWFNLDLIPANIRLFDAEFAIPSRQMSTPGFRFFDILTDEIENNASLQDYDLICIDLPPSFSYMTINALYASDAMVVPCPPNHLDILATGAFFDQLTLVMETIEKNFDYQKNFDFVSALRTKMEADPQSIRNGGRIAAIFQQDLIQEQALTSKVVKLATDKNLTIYELDGAEVDRRTYKRAIDSFNAINEEILMRVKESVSK
ncbi:MAG: AAA family ATPase [Methyloprofundus sp.]|nr:AAA family ATPase [Methyloprofundus sp.]